MMECIIYYCRTYTYRKFLLVLSLKFILKSVAKFIEGFQIKKAAGKY